MRLLLFILFLVPSLGHTSCYDQKPKTLPLLIANNVKQAAQIARQIHYEACFYGVEETLVAKIIIVESRGNPLAYNESTHDYGLMQINEKTADEYRVPNECLLGACHLHHAVYILADYQNRHGYRPCMWHVGPTGAHKWNQACEAYEQKLAAVKD